MFTFYRLQNLMTSKRTSRKRLLLLPNWYGKLLSFAVNGDVHIFL